MLGRDEDMSRTFRMIAYRITVPALVLAGALFACTTAADAAGILFGLSSSDDGGLYTISEGTGAASLVTRINVPTSLVGLEFLRGTLYATDVFVGGTFTIGTIDTVTGVYTPIGNQDGSANWHGLAADQAANMLYSIDIDDSGKLKSMTPGGVVTTIGTGTGIDGRGMAFDDANKILYATGSGGALYTVDTISGVATLIGDMGIGSERIGLAMDEVTGVLYANRGDDALYTLNVTTGEATLVGNNGPTEGNGIDGLAWLGSSRAVPEPAALLLVALGLIGLVAFRRGSKSE